MNDNPLYKEGDEVFATAHPKFGYSPMTVLETFPTGVVVFHHELDKKIALPNRDVTLATKNRRELLEDALQAKRTFEAKENSLFTPQPTQ